MGGERDSGREGSATEWRKERLAVVGVRWAVLLSLSRILLVNFW